MAANTKAWNRGRDSINIVLWVKPELGPYINAISVWENTYWMIPSGENFFFYFTNRKTLVSMQTSNAIYLKLALLRRVAKYDLFVIIYPVYWKVQTFSLTFQLARSQFIGLTDNIKLCGCQNFYIIIYSLGGKRNQTVLSIMKLFTSLVLSKLYSGGYNSWKLQQTIGHFEFILNRVPAWLWFVPSMGSCVLRTNRPNFVPGTLRLSVYIIYGLFRDAFTGCDYIYRQKIGLLVNNEF